MQPCYYLAPPSMPPSLQPPLSSRLLLSIHTDTNVFSIRPPIVLTIHFQNPRRSSDPSSLFILHPSSPWTLTLHNLFPRTPLPSPPTQAKPTPSLPHFLTLPPPHPAQRCAIRTVATMALRSEPGQVVCRNAAGRHCEERDVCVWPQAYWLC